MLLGQIRWWACCNLRLPTPCHNVTVDLSILCNAWCTRFPYRSYIISDHYFVSNRSIGFHIPPYFANLQLFHGQLQAALHQRVYLQCPHLDIDSQHGYSAYYSTTIRSQPYNHHGPTAPSLISTSLEHWIRPAFGPYSIALFTNLGYRVNRQNVINVAITPT
jgi:hypothetical protein